MSLASTLFRSASLAVASVFVLAFSGCAAVNMTASSPQQSSGLAIQGKIHGGSQPVSGARIYLLAANTTDYPTAGSFASTSLLTAATGSTADSIGYYVTSDANANFSITGDYTCTAGQQVYLLALGGDPGLGATNSHIGLATVLGNCPSSGNFAASIPNLFVDEVTTVAAAYSLAGFAVDDLHVGAPSVTRPAALTGITNAFANFSLLTDVATGSAKSTTGAGSGVVPQSEINTLANILSSCINSTGNTTVTTSNCSKLFAAATSDGTSNGTVPSDTFTAAINIAHHPAANISTLCALQPGTGAPFQPNLACSTSALPNDFTLSIRYPESTGATLNDLAVDAAGNVIVVGSGGLVGRYVASSGYAEAPLAFGSTINFTDVAVGVSDIFAADAANDYIYDVAVNFDAPTSLIHTVNASSNPVQPAGLALSANGSTLYVCDASTGGGVLRYSPSGAFLGETTGYFSQPVRAAVDTAGNVWAMNLNSATVGEMTSAGGAISGEPTAGRSLPYSNGGSGVALDQTGLVWVTSDSGGAAGQVSPTGSNIAGTSSPYRYSGGFGQYYPRAVAVDGANSAWMANTLNGTAQSLSQFSSTGAGLSAANGYVTSNADNTNLKAVAIDSAGSVWTIGSHLYQFIGAATPTVTPIVSSLNAPYTTAAAKP